ncbi:hypothetical protein [Streptomyces sp. NPDC047718]
MTVNTALAAHRAYRRSIDELREMGVPQEAVDLLAPLLRAGAEPQ